jgi:hypothetical protein
VQNGSGNRSETYQTGGGNYSSSLQQGSGNQFTSHQSGGERLIVDQIGNNNSFDSRQYDGSLGMTVRMAGNGLDIKVMQLPPAATAAPGK